MNSYAKEQEIKRILMKEISDLKFKFLEKETLSKSFVIKNINLFLIKRKISILQSRLENIRLQEKAGK